MYKIISCFESVVLNRDLFRVVNLVICLIYFMPSTYNIANMPMKGAVVWGSIIIVYEILIKRSFFKMRYSYLLILGIVSFMITVLLNRAYFFVPSIYNLVYLMITLIVIYPVDFSQDSETRKKKIIQFNNVFIVIILIATFISIVQFVLLISYRVPTGTPGIVARQGFIENRLFGVYTSPNVGAMFGYTSIILSIFSGLLNNLTKKIQLLYIINFAVQVIYIILSSSRGAQLVIISFLFLFLVFLFQSSFRKAVTERTSINIRWLIAIALIFLVFFTIGNTYAKNLLAKIPVAIENKIEIKKTDQVEDNLDRPDKVVVQHSDGNSEFSAGRFSIWKAAVKATEPTLFFGHGETDFFGNSDGTVLDKVQLNSMDINELRRAHGNMHNGYIQVIVSSGIIGFICFYIFYMCNIFKLIKLFFIKKSQSVEIDYALLGIVLIFLLSIFANELVESHLLFNKRDVISIVFWYYLGNISFMYLKKEN